MRRSDLIVELANEWLEKAEEDYALIRHLMSEKVPYFSAVAFHAQQSVEKFLKAFLVFNQVEFPKTHDIDRLLDLIHNIDEQLAKRLRSTGALTPFGVDVRYPGDFPDVCENDAEKSLQLVEITADEIRGRLGV